MSKGSWFRSAGDVDDSMFFRATFAAAPADKMDEAIKRLGEALREEFEIQE